MYAFLQIINFNEDNKGEWAFFAHSPKELHVIVLQN